MRSIGMSVDRMYCPPSNRGIVKQLLRKGYLTKHRSGLPSSRRSHVIITKKGIDYLYKKCPDFVKGFNDG